MTLYGLQLFYIGLSSLLFHGVRANGLIDTISIETCCDDSSSASFYIEHSFDSGVTFKKRNTFQQLSTGEASFLPTEMLSGVQQEDIESFQKLLKTNALYTIRMNAQAKNCSSDAVYAVIPACELQKSNFKEDIALHMDRGGHIIGLHYTSPVIALPRACNPKKIPSDKDLKFQTNLRILEPTTAGVIPVQAQGPRPPTLAHVKLNIEDVSEAGKPEADQSFMRKYWYIVLPMVLFTVFGGGESPAATEGEGGGAAPVASPAAPK